MKLVLDNSRIRDAADPTPSPSFHMTRVRDVPLSKRGKVTPGDERWLKISSQTIHPRAKITFRDTARPGWEPSEGRPCKLVDDISPVGVFSEAITHYYLDSVYREKVARRGEWRGRERERGKSKENTRAWQKREMERERGEGFKDTARARAAKNFFSPRKTFRSFPLIEKSADCFSAMRVSARAEISPWTMREE